MAQCLSQLECMRATCSGAHVATTNEKSLRLTADGGVSCGSGVSRKAKER